MAYRLHMAEVRAGLHRSRRPLLILAAVCAVIGLGALAVLFLF